ncbi:MAG TPA: exodeoxyribonuclease VII large subunit [Bdellovibrionota bacterium]|nr:exodeoxyribonuclease VII large subunit [Bdellovibrionota bacterium]
MDLFEYASQQQEEPEEGERQFNEAIYTVSEITSEVKSLIHARFGKSSIWIKGEISNFKGRNQSGHMYFFLKDENAVLNCVFFRNANQRIDFELQEGLEVLALGRLDVWAPGGKYQLIIEAIRPGGAGELYLRFEQLKKKLELEGLFDPARKRKLPAFPKRIGLITSPTGAAIRDMIHVIRTRCPIVKLLLFPVKVQGEGAAQEIAAAIEEANRPNHGLEVLIAGRGGGSIEDLWAFNEEIVARSIVASRLPLISAVGHQTDFTISDFVADVRAATPSQAAELVVPNLGILRQRVESLIRNIVHDLHRQWELAAARLKELNRAAPLRDPRVLIESRMQRLDTAVERMVDRLRERKDREGDRVSRAYDRLRIFLAKLMVPRKLRFEKSVSNLSMLNPLSILARGYSVVSREGGQIVKRSGQVHRGEQVSVRLYEGGLACQVTQILKTSET